MTDHTRRPGVGLRPYREQRGLTQAQVAQEVSQLAWYRHRQHVGVNADMVSKWERRAKAVSGFYQELLCELFGATPEQLGFRPPSAQPAPDDGDTGAGGVAAILAQLGGAAALLGPAVLDAWKVEHVKRRTLLKLMGTVPVALTTGTAGQSTAATARQLDTLAAGYQTLYHSSTPIDLMAPVAAHLRTVAALLRQNPGPLERRQMLRNRSRVATLAGRIAFFDLDDPMSARSYYQVAVEAAQEADDRLLAAAALGHLSFIPAAEGSFTAAEDYLRGAAAQMKPRQHAGVTSWLSAVAAEMHTNAGDHDAALRAVDRAGQVLDDGPAPDLPWFDFYDQTRLAGFAGYTLLRAGQFDRAERALTSALATLPLQSVKQRAVFLADIASVHLERSDVDAACNSALQAIDALDLAGYATGTGRLHQLRSRLAPWQTHPGVRALNDRLRVA